MDETHCDKAGWWKEVSLKKFDFWFFPDSDVPDARCKLEEVGTKIDWNQNNNYLYLSAIIVLAQQFTKRNFEASLSQSWILSASY